MQIREWFSKCKTSTVYDMSMSLLGPVGGVLAMLALWAGATYLAGHVSAWSSLIAALPAAFMSALKKETKVVSESVSE